MIRWLLSKFAPKRPPTHYVVIYDDIEESGDAAEQYYGYFADPDEAAHMWESFAAGQTRYTDPRLCLVIGDLNLGMMSEEREPALMTG